MADRGTRRVIARSRARRARSACAARSFRIATGARSATPFDDDGWAHFGDLGFLDEDGFVHITGRIKDTIIRGGNNINPLEVEELLREHPEIREVCVVGRPDPDLGERAVAFVVASPTLTLEQLTAFVGRPRADRVTSGPSGWSSSNAADSAQPEKSTATALRDARRRADRR